MFWIIGPAEWKRKRQARHYYLLPSPSTAAGLPTLTPRMITLVVLVVALATIPPQKDARRRPITNICFFDPSINSDVRPVKKERTQLSHSSQLINS